VKNRSLRWKIEHILYWFIFFRFLMVITPSNDDLSLSSDKEYFWYCVFSSNILSRYSARSWTDVAATLADYHRRKASLACKVFETLAEVQRLRLKYRTTLIVRADVQLSLEKLLFRKLSRRRLTRNDDIFFKFHNCDDIFFTSSYFTSSFIM